MGGNFKLGPFGAHRPPATSFARFEDGVWWGEGGSSTSDRCLVPKRGESGMSFVGISFFGWFLRGNPREAGSYFGNFPFFQDEPWLGIRESELLGQLVCYRFRCAG